MKKIVLAIVAVATFTCAVQAQQYSTFSLVPRAGISLSNMDFNEDEENQGSALGFVGGIGVNIPITSDGFASIKPELLYIQQGYKYSDNGNDVKRHFNYLQLPLLLKINFGTEAIKAYVNGGPSFGYFLSGKETGGDNDRKIKLSDTDKFPDSDAIYVNKNDINRLDIGLQFGGGVGVQAGPGVLGLDVRYGLGLTDFENEEGAPDSENKSKHRVIQLALEYAIPLGGK